MDTQGNFTTGANVFLPALDATAPVSAVSFAIQANDSHRAALNARRALLKTQIENGDIMLENMCKFVDPSLEEVRVKNLDEWAVFALEATAVRPLLTNKQLNADTLRDASDSMVYLQDSPFREEAENHKYYLAHTSSHPWTNKEREALKKQIINENKRLSALELHNSNQNDSLDAIAEQDDANFEKNIEDIDWKRVASSMSEVSRSVLGKRTAQECKVQWLGNDHPDLRDPTIWDDEDDDVLRDLVGDRDVRGGDVDWVEVAAQFKGSRTPAQCLGRWILLEEDADASSDVKAPWTGEQDADFRVALEEHGVGNWAATMESGRSPAACAHRFAQTLKPDIRRGMWSADEDNKLREAVTVHGEKWSRVKDLVPGRTAAQCRERFVRSIPLTSAAKVGPWAKKEDTQLLRVVSMFGTKDWESVAKCIGRNVKQCRKRWKRLQNDQAGSSEEEDVLPRKRGRPKGTKADKTIPSLPTASTVLGSASSRPQEQRLLSSTTCEPTAAGGHSISAATPNSPQLSTPAHVPALTSVQETVSDNSTFQPRDQVETQGPVASSREKPNPKPKPRYTGPSTVVSNSGDSSVLGASEPRVPAGNSATPSGPSAARCEVASPGGTQGAPNEEPEKTEGLRRSSRLKRG